MNEYRESPNIEDGIETGDKLLVAPEQVVLKGLTRIKHDLRKLWTNSDIPIPPPTPMELIDSIPPGVF